MASTERLRRRFAKQGRTWRDLTKPYRIGDTWVLSEEVLEDFPTIRANLERMLREPAARAHEEAVRRLIGGTGAGSSTLGLLNQIGNS